MNTLDQSRWETLWKATGAAGNPMPWFLVLVNAYAESQRHYHNSQHIAECLTQFDVGRHLALQPAAIEFALWFHDAVYDPKAGDYEEKSAKLAERCLQEAGLDAEFITTVVRLVLATKKHDGGGDKDTELMLDIDLSILGQPPERFGQYESQIRQEYSWVPEEIFAEKRAEILEQFLQRKNIYNTSYFRDRLERQARNNLRKSIQTLLV